ncbi:uncharacterized protein LOC122508661 isoform X2 [Leptopilina heterotoma]|uniref:uncharacterized protein LOC122508661 isoform X2 n=1 Tax=Leptopilina heterotoma TaxID=63436 RepID=UPI001CA9E441|nr:uncharacterized protein LOC122508661 isoform X2 [Leptopilina heterotoma]
METHHPIKCHLCGETKKLKRCSSCRMISYCGKEHQMEHRAEHKKLCKIITEIFKAKGKSHIYENMDQAEFFEEKCRIIAEVEAKLKRPLNAQELMLLAQPRLCFICREANQDKLKTCQKCLIASFCDLHPSSHIHERFCIIQSAEITRETAFKFDANSNIKSQINSFLKGMKDMKQDDSLPKSMIDFFDSFTKEKISAKDKILLSEYFSIPLTICSSLRTLFSTIPSKVQIHLKSRHCPWTIFAFEFWEILLHLLPEVKTLEIIYIEDELPSAEKLKINLCKDCKMKKKTIQIERNPIMYEKPTLIAIFSSSPSEEKKIIQNIFNFNGEKDENAVQKLPCPIVITSSCQDVHNAEVNLFLTKFKNYEIVYNNYNDYSSLLKLHPEVFFRHSLFVAILKPNDEKKSIKISSHYPQLCHYCKKQEGKLQCKQCRVVYYCDKKHENQDKINHSELCDVICRLRKEIEGGKQLFHGAAKLAMDEENWIKMRLEILRNAEIRIKRKLTKEEEEIFLFPRACGICHEIDASLLKNCECGVFLCKKHKNDPEHKKACGELSIAFKMSTRQPIVNDNFSIFNETPDENTMKNFVATMFSLLEEIFIDEMFNENLSGMTLLNAPSDNRMTVKGDFTTKKLFTSNFLSSPITLIYALEKMNVPIKSSMTIHVIGEKPEDFEKKFLWTFLFFNVEKLASLKLIFIDSEFIDFPEIPINNFSEMKINLKIEGHAVNYEKYSSSEKFIKPDIIFGCNLEKKSTKSEIFSEKAILGLKKLQVPLILTAGTKERAEKIHRIFSANNLNYKFFEENPFVSLLPERDFETKGVLYSNEYLFGYDFQDLANSTEEEVKQEVCASTEISTKNDFESKKKISASSEINAEKKLESKEEKVSAAEISTKTDLKSNEKVPKSNKKSTKNDFESKEKISVSSEIVTEKNLESKKEKVSAAEIMSKENLEPKEKVSKSNKKSTKNDFESKENISGSSKINGENNLKLKEEKISAAEIMSKENLEPKEKVSKSNKKSATNDFKLKENISGSSEIIGENNLKLKEEKISATEISMEENLEPKKKVSDKISTKNNFESNGKIPESNEISRENNLSSQKIDSQPKEIDTKNTFEPTNKDDFKSRENSSKNNFESKKNSKKQLQSKEKNSESIGISPKNNIDPKAKVCEPKENGLKSKEKKQKEVNSKIDSNEKSLFAMIEKIEKSELEEIIFKSTENNRESSIHDNLKQSSTKVTAIEEFLAREEKKSEQNSQFLKIQLFVKQNKETGEKQGKMDEKKNIKTPMNLKNGNEEETKVEKIDKEEKETKKIQEIGKENNSDFREENIKKGENQEKKKEEEIIENPVNLQDKNEEKSKVQNIDKKENVEKKKSQKIEGGKNKVKNGEKKKEDLITPVNLKNKNEGKTKIDSKENEKKKSLKIEGEKNGEKQEDKKKEVNLITPSNLKNKNDEGTKVEKNDNKEKETKKSQEIKKANNSEIKEESIEKAKNQEKKIGQENLITSANLKNGNDERTKVEKNDNKEKETKKLQEIEKENNNEIKGESKEKAKNQEKKNEQENLITPANFKNRNDEGKEVEKIKNQEIETKKQQEIEKENSEFRGENVEKKKHPEKKNGEETAAEEKYKEFVDLLKKSIKRTNDDDDETKNIELTNKISKSNHHRDEKVEQESKKPKIELEASLSPDSLSEDEKNSSHQIENKNSNQELTTNILVKNSESESLSLDSLSDGENASLQIELMNLIEKLENKPDLSLKEQNSSLEKKIEKLQDDLNSANTVIENLRKQILIFQNIYPTIIDGNNLIKKALVSIEENFGPVVEKK